MPTSTKLQSGFSLIEVLVAATVFSTAVLLLLGTFTLVLNYDLNSRNVTVATAAANDKIEQLRLSGFDNIVVPTTTVTSFSNLTGGQMKVTTSIYNNNAKIKLVEVKVYWDNRPESRAVTLTTLIGQGGVHG